MARIAGVTLLLAAAQALSAPPPKADSILLPLREQAGWQVLTYRGIPAHRIRFSGAGLEMAIDGSAMPLVYPLSKPTQIKAVRVKGRVDGTLRIPAGRQGERGFDDYVFRIGLVEPGTRTLNFVERQIAAAWVRKLFELAPKGSGISRIHFFNVGMEQTHISATRQHPASDLLLEQVVTALRPDGRFDFVHTLERPLDAVAVWLSSDGDDTGSKFTVLVEEIELRGPP